MGQRKVVGQMAVFEVWEGDELGLGWIQTVKPPDCASWSEGKEGAGRWNHVHRGDGSKPSGDHRLR